MRCSKCFSEKSSSMFEPDKRKKNGFHSHCKLCRSKYRKALYHSDPEKQKAYSAAWKIRNRERARAIARSSHLRVNFGMSVSDYEALYKSQHGRCVICSAHGSMWNGLVVDHNHFTGAVRGLLCHPCNKGIGQMRDDPVIVAAALKYLVSWT